MVRERERERESSGHSAWNNKNYDEDGIRHNKQTGHESASASASAILVINKHWPFWVVVVVQC